MLSSNLPITLLWGEDGVMFYNAGYAEIAGRRHPSIMGSKVLEGWPEVASFNRHVLESGFRGESLAFEDQHLVLMRNGVAEDVWLDLDYSPGFRRRRQARPASLPLSTKRRGATSPRRRRSSNRERLSHALNAASVVGSLGLACRYRPDVRG